MKWVRSPTWDCCWFLNAPVMALLMLVPFAFPREARVCIMLGIMSVGLGHTLSPIALAWSHSGYRGVMLQRPRKFIWTPALLVAIGVAVPLATIWFVPRYHYGGEMLENLTAGSLWVPFVVWANLYAVWNLYHGGAQNFGMLCLYRGKGFWGWRKLAVLMASVALTAFLAHFAAHILPRSSYSKIVFLVCFGGVTLNHYLTAIGLSAHVWSNHYKLSPWWFVVGVVFVGTCLTLGLHQMVLYSTFVGLLGLSLRSALGIWHFLQDRWIWQLSKPEVRATIGKDLFAHA